MSWKSGSKRFWLGTGAVLLIGVAVIAIWKRPNWLFPVREVSSLYADFAEKEGVNAVFFKDYRLSDSIVCDVIVLQAVTDSGWAKLLRAFNASERDRQSDDDRSSVELWYAPKACHACPMDTDLLKNDLVILSCSRRTVSVYDIKEIAQVSAIIGYSLSELKKTKKS